MNRLLLLALLGIVLAMPAQAKEESAAAAKAAQTDAKPEIKEVLSEEMAKARQEKEEFVSKAQKDLDALDAKLVELKKKALEKTGEVKVKLDKRIKALEQKQEIAREKLAALKGATIDKWREFKNEVSIAINRLNQALKKE